MTTRLQASCWKASMTILHLLITAVREPWLIRKKKRWLACSSPLIHKLSANLRMAVEKQWAYIVCLIYAFALCIAAILRMVYYFEDHPSSCVIQMTAEKGSQEAVNKILQQLMVEPNPSREKRQMIILLGDVTLSWQLLNAANEAFPKCPISTCFALDALPSTDVNPDAMIVSNIVPKLVNRPREQIWIYYSLESPQNTPSLYHLNGLINWTATYRLDSDLPLPYGLYRRQNDIKIVRHVSPDHCSHSLADKTSDVAWFASNCFTLNRRSDYVRELSRHIQVDVYGDCGRHRCRRGSPICWEMLSRKYKFYLAFENSNCREYVTEKLFINAMRHNVVPVVMGAAKEDYDRLVPPGSFIHVDDFASPKRLADYLKKVGQNQTLYDSFFSWRDYYEEMDTRFWCRLCAKLHESVHTSKLYHDLEEWWRPDNICSPPTWLSPNQT